MNKDTHGKKGKPWIGVDLDGTLAEYNGWVGIHHIGKPVHKMAERVRNWIREGRDVRIMTARVSPDGLNDVDTARAFINHWMNTHFGFTLPVVYAKDYLMEELWDDRCVQVIQNTGERADGKEQ